jgi:malate dehydrogenase (oxaloacetate-decarboxylating)(NADP+)
MYIFPGIGLAASISGVSLITDKMLYVAAEACTNTMTAEEREEGRTFPDITRIREVSKQVAVAVIQEGIDAGLVTKLTSKDLEDGLESLVDKKMYYPDYVPIRSTYGH